MRLLTFHDTILSAFEGQAGVVYVTPFGCDHFGSFSFCCFLAGFFFVAVLGMLWLGIFVFGELVLLYTAIEE